MAITVLSLFNGYGGAHIALQRAGVKYDRFYSSEIDPMAIKACHAHFPDTIELGDVRKLRLYLCTSQRNRNIMKAHRDTSAVTLRLINHCEDILRDGVWMLTGGFPCQAFSVAGKQLAFNDYRGKLFFDMIKIFNTLKARNPAMLYLFENVPMKKQNEAVINKLIGHRPIRLNAADFSAQNRLRLFWVSWPVTTVPVDKGILLRDILEHGDVNIEKSGTIDAEYGKAGYSENHEQSKRRYMVYQSAHGYNAGAVHQDKSPPVTLSKWQDNNHIIELTGSESQSGRVYSDEGKMAALPAGGQSRHMKVASSGIIQIATDEETGKRPEMDNRVYDADGKAPTMLNSHHNNRAVAIKQVGRRILNNKRADNNLDIPMQQRFEFGGEKSHCLSTFGKDSMVGIVANVNPSGNGMNGNVWETDGKSATIMSDNHPLKILHQQDRINEPSGKANTLVSGSHNNASSYTKTIIINGQSYHIRKLTVAECCRLQTISWDNHFEGIVSNSAAYKLIGNGWCIDCVVWLLSFIPKTDTE